ncbi:MAG: hypothetical protein HY680_04085 [Chloroflexi bacterium]|nr:hypothetical protein [Chloroflexota bacterium]
MQKTIAITYEQDALEEIGAFLPYVQGAVSKGIELGRNHGAPVDAVRVTRFVDFEDPTFVEVVLTFYSSAEPGKRHALFDLMADFLGEWAHTLPGPAKGIANRIGVDVLIAGPA